MVVVSVVRSTGVYRCLFHFFSAGQDRLSHARNLKEITGANDTTAGSGIEGTVSHSAQSTALRMLQKTSCFLRKHLPFLPSSLMIGCDTTQSWPI